MRRRFRPWRQRLLRWSRSGPQECAANTTNLTQRRHSRWSRLMAKTSNYLMIPKRFMMR